jgi:hypothetical protein
VAFTSQSGMPVILADGSEQAFIAPYSIDLLPCLPEMREQLHLLGIKSIGQLSLFSRDALIAQFGLEGQRAYELATGCDTSLLVPKKKPDVAVDTMELCPPLESRIDVSKACEVILERLLPGIKTKGKLCYEVWLQLRFESCSLEAKKLHLKRATTSQRAIIKRIEAWLEGTRLPAPINEIELVLRLTNEKGERPSLWHEFKGDQGLGRAAQELKSRFGYQPLKRIKVIDRGAILPERRCRLIEVVDEEFEP